MVARCLILVALSVTACGTSDSDDACPLQPQSGSACSTEAQSCPIEGTGTCDQPPAGGTCSCTSGTWACQSGCADGCPMQLPTEAATCTLASGTECRYSYPTLTRCTCTTGAFHCM